MIKDLNNIYALGKKAQGLRARDIEAFRRYWDAMRKDGDIPRRSDIDPRGIEPLLAQAFVAERIAPGLARLRIAGNHLTDLMGMEVRGMPLSSFLLPAYRDKFSSLLVDVFDTPAMVDLGLSGEARAGQATLAGRMVLMPLRSDLGDTSRALGCLVTDGPLGRAPRRFAITGSTISPIRKANPVPPTLGFSEPQAPGFSRSQNLETRPPSPSERPYLRLVKSE
jgi:hypothetical protein